MRSLLWEGRGGGGGIGHVDSLTHLKLFGDMPLPLPLPLHSSYAYAVLVSLIFLVPVSEYINKYCSVQMCTLIRIFIVIYMLLTLFQAINLPLSDDALEGLFERMDLNENNELEYE